MKEVKSAIHRQYREIPDIAEGLYFARLYSCRKLDEKNQESRACHLDLHQELLIMSANGFRGSWFQEESVPGIKSHAV